MNVLRILENFESINISEPRHVSFLCQLLCRLKPCHFHRFVTVHLCTTGTRPNHPSVQPLELIEQPLGLPFFENVTILGANDAFRGRRSHRVGAPLVLQIELLLQVRFQMLFVLLVLHIQALICLIVLCRGARVGRLIV